MVDEKKEAAQKAAITKVINTVKTFSNKEFTIKKTKFSITKLPPMHGFKVVEQIRVHLVTSASNFEVKSQSDEENAALFFKAILGLPPTFIDYLMSELFAGIEFTGQEIGAKVGLLPLKGSEDMAFQEFEVIHIYEVLGRALCVNFSGSFSGIIAAFPGAELFINQLIQKI